MPITERQRELRTRHLGSSDMPAILGVDPWRNAADVYYSKIGDLDEWGGNDATDAGDRLEPVLLDWAADELGRKIRKNQRRVNGIFAANLDAIVLDLPEAIEAKTTGLFNPMYSGEEWGTEGTDEVPDRVLIQAHQQMLVADLMRVWVPALIGGRGFSLFRIDRNADLIGVIQAEGERFWNEHVLPEIPPPDLIPSLDVLKRARREPNKTTQIDPDLLQDYLTAKAAAKYASARKSEAQARLLEALGDAEAGECDIGSVTYLEQTRRGFDTKRFKADHPELHDEYQTETTYRVLRDKVAKGA